MHTNLHFSFYYPVMQALRDKGQVRYTHLTDLTINGKGTKNHDGKDVSFTFEIDEVLAENENILSLLEEANGLEGIKAACRHHIKHVSFARQADFRMSYLPLKKAI